MQVALFKFVFGDKFEPVRKLPFLIGDETTHRPITLTHNLMFAYGTNTYGWLKRRGEADILWAYLLDYFFSLIGYVDNRIFDIAMEKKNNVFLPVRADLKRIQSRLRKIMHWCFEYQDPTNGAPEGESRRQYLKEFKDRMDNLDHYPGDLKQLWDSIKSEYA